jgi:hypothetical protein
VRCSSPAQEFAALAAVFRRRLVVGATTAAAAAVGANFGGVTSFLLGLSPQLGRSLRLDVLYPVGGFTRCLDSDNGFGNYTHTHIYYQSRFLFFPLLGLAIGVAFASSKNIGGCLSRSPIVRNCLFFDLFVLCGSVDFNYSSNCLRKRKIENTLSRHHLLLYFKTPFSFFLIKSLKL